MTHRPTGLGSGDVLTVSEAAAALRMRQSHARRWLRDRGLVVEVAGRPRVPWGRVLAALGGREPEPGGRSGGGWGNLPEKEL